MLRDHNKRQYMQFFNDIPKCLTDGSNDSTISYLVLPQNGAPRVVAARLTLGDDRGESGFPPALKSGNVQAGYFLLKELGISIHDYLANVLDKGSFEIPGNALYFPEGGDGGHGVWYRELTDEGLHVSKRISVLSLFGGQREPLPQPAAIDWELKAADPSFDGLEELAQVYRFGPISGGTVTFDVVAPEALEVLPTSTLNGDSARILIAAKYKLDQSAVSLRLRIDEDGQTVDRMTIKDGDIEWDTRSSTHGIGIATVGVLKTGTLHCTAVYAGRAQHERTIVDQAARNNMLRMLFESADSGLEVLKKRLASGKETKTPGQDLEGAIAWLLGMLGFQVLNVGTFSKAQDGVDIIARCPSGGILLIECTTDILKEDKTSKLLARVAKLKSRLTDSDLRNVHVLPVMLTTAPHNQVELRIANTESTGVLVMTGEQINEWVELSAAAPDADREFERLNRRLEHALARARHASQILPLGLGMGLGTDAH